MKIVETIVDKGETIMARQEINLGNTPSGQGPGADTSRSAFDKCNKNFEELYDDSATLKEEVPLAEAEEGISSKVRGWTARRVSQAAISAWNTLTTPFTRTLLSHSTADEVRGELQLGTAATKNVGNAGGNVMQVGTRNWGWMTTPTREVDFNDFSNTDLYPVNGASYLYSTQNEGGPSTSGTHVFTMKLDDTYQAQIGIQHNGRAFVRAVSGGTVRNWSELMRSENFTIASGGTLKAASTIITLFNDKHEIENESEFGLTPSVVKLSTGTYEITNTLGLRADSWFLDTPQDRNGNKYFNVDYEEVIGTKVEGVLDLDVKEPDEVEEFLGTLEPTKTIIRCFERVWNPQTGLFENGEPTDIKEGRFITLRFNEVAYTPKLEESENVG